MIPFLMVVAVSVVVESVRPYFLKLILDSAQTDNSGGVMTNLMWFGVCTIGSAWIGAVAYYLGDRVMIPFAREIREAVFKKVLELDFAYHVNKNTGALISAFKRGDGAVFNLFFNLYQELFRVLINLLVTVYFLYLASPEMAYMLIGLFGGNMLLIWWLIKVNLSARTRFNETEDEVSGVITDSLINYETVKFFAAENKEKLRLSNTFRTWTKAFWKFSNSYRLMDIGIGTISGLGVMAIIWQAVNKLGNEFSLGDLVMVTGFITGFHYQFYNLFFRIRDIAKNMTDLMKYLEILDIDVAVKDPVTPELPKNVKGEIEFEKVAFAYPSDKEKTLQDISVTIKSGQTVAFVGRSGAGKTTLIKLLLRFYDPTSGVIKLDGMDIRKMKKTDLRSMVGVVPQEPIMFNNTVEFNLAYGNENANKELIEEAARRANILEFIETLPEKWKTMVGERGIKLSGGQKQRLAIARALLSDPKVLVFDEATSNLDSESEGKIQEALAEVAKKRTVIIIAHRFSTIRNVDNIIVLSDGTVLEEGNHEKLIAKDGVYKRLWTLQAKGKLL